MTVRDDIRVMRSEILGFNAPIEQKDGLYFYSNPKYTILSVGITDPAILDPVIKSLLKIRNEVKHPELEIVLNKLRALSPESFKTEKYKLKYLSQKSIILMKSEKFMKSLRMKRLDLEFIQGKLIQRLINWHRCRFGVNS